MGNLPAEFGSFVGRRRELSEVRRLFTSARLVTLTGVGGVGKSRLAVRVAEQMRRAFPEGVWFVELAGLHDPLLLPQAVSEALGIRDQSDRDPVEVLAGFLADGQVLLVVDNCEHLVEASALLVVDLLRAAPGLRLLVTSREVLKVPGEHVYPVAPLPVPAEPMAAGVDVQCPGMALFAERAATVRPGFAVTGENAATVARICQRLEGIPLALELAAARLGALSEDQLAARLDDRFRLLGTDRQARLPRHRTMRAAVEWSFELCTKPERVLWARASVFTGRFDLEAAEGVCAGEGLAVEEVYEAVAGLVDKSVLIAEEHTGGGARYRLLDTIRAFGLDGLRDQDQTDGLAVVDEATLRARHRDYYVELAERFHTDWFGPRQVQWSVRMRAERENLRAALGYCLDTPGQQRAGLRLAGALYYYWFSGEPREGRHWLERILPADPEPSRERMRALIAYGQVLLAQGAAASAIEPTRECVELARRFDEPFSQIVAVSILGMIHLFCDELRAALVLLEQAVALAGELADTHPWALAFAQQHLAVGRLFAGEPAAASALATDSAAICRAHGDQWYLHCVLGFAVNPALALGDVVQATAYARETLQACCVLRNPVSAPMALEFLAWTAAVEQDYPRAARLLGAADRQQRDIGQSPFVGPWAQRHQQCETATRDALGDTAYDAAHRGGSELSLDAAAAYASGEQDRPSAVPAPERDELPSLTRREREVAELVAQGRTNKEIAAHLVIAQRTAESHVDRIRSKLGFASRAQIATWIASQGSVRISAEGRPV